MNPHIHPCPEHISAAVVQLFSEWRRNEITPEEYNRRFAELQQEAKRAEVRKEIENSRVKVD